MAQIIKLLLSKNTRLRSARLEEAAVSIYDAAFKKVKQKMEALRKNSFGADEITPSLVAVLTPLLSRENLIDDRSYQLLYQAINDWKLKSPPDWEEHEEQLQFKVFRVKQILSEYLLPVVREQQKKDQLKREALKGECTKYFAHLNAVIQKEKAKVKPDQESLTLAKAKRDAIIGMDKALRAKGLSPSAQLEKFKGLLKKNRELLETCRDSTEMTILKAFVTILSLGAAYAFGIWKTEGSRTAKKIDAILEVNEAKDLPRRSIRSKSV